MSKAKSFEWFKTEIQNRNIDNIEIIGEYINMSTKLLVKCNECGNEWMAHPQRILRGHRCKKCALKERNTSKNQRKTTNEFKSELAGKNPNIIVKGEYKSAKTKIKCECRTCGYVWKSRPYNLLTGYGCPECMKTRVRGKQAKSPETFIQQMNLLNPDVIVVGQYVNNHTKILCKCASCGNIWEAEPANLLAGTSCPRHRSSRGERSVRNWLDKYSIQYEEQKRFQDLRGLGGRTMPYDFYIPSENIIIEYQGEFHDNTARIQRDDNYQTVQIHDALKREYAINHNYKFYEIWYYQDVDVQLQKIFNITNPVTTTVT